MGRSSTVTEGIRVEVESVYVAERSEPSRRLFFFAYQVTLSNEGDLAAQLTTRHWIITDGEGREEHVHGPGVVGKSPQLLPGESFQYMSYCPLPTPIGSMAGTYRMVREDGREFDAQIDAFSLEVPGTLN